MSLDYKKAGVDIEAGEELVGWLKQNQPSQWPHQSRLVGGIGGFAALFRAGFPEMKSPCLVSSTDGVGTKLKLAVEFESYSSVAQDLVAMCVNDLVCCGAQPLFFLDYYACGKLRLEPAKEFLSGLQQACIDSDCALIGGETAEMPGMYSDKDFDCAGFSVGVVDEEKVLGRHRVNAGDQLIAVASSGFHSNGFSLLRKVFESDLHAWKEELLKPTALYAKMVKSLLQDEQCQVNAIANITGGGMDNILRVIPSELSVQLDAWEMPEPFVEVKRRGDMQWSSLLQTLNCGIGLVLVVPPSQLDNVLLKINSQGYKSWRLGEVVANKDEQSAWFVDESKWTS